MVDYSKSFTATKTDYSKSPSYGTRDNPMSAEDLGIEKPEKYTSFDIPASITPGLQEGLGNPENQPTLLEGNSQNLKDAEDNSLVGSYIENTENPNIDDVKSIVNRPVDSSLGSNFTRANGIPDDNGEVSQSVDSAYHQEVDDKTVLQNFGYDPNTNTINDAMDDESNPDIETLMKHTPVSQAEMDNHPNALHVPIPGKRDTDSGYDSRMDNLDPSGNPKGPTLRDWLKRISWYEPHPEAAKDFDEDLVALTTKFVTSKFNNDTYGANQFFKDYATQAEARYGKHWGYTFAASTAKEVGVDAAVYTGLAALAATGAGSSAATEGFAVKSAKDLRRLDKVLIGVKKAFYRSMAVGAGGGVVQAGLQAATDRDMNLFEESVGRAVGALVGEGAFTGTRLGYSEIKKLVKGKTFKQLKEAIAKEISKNFSVPQHKLTTSVPLMKQMIKNNVSNPVVGQMNNQMVNDFVTKGDTTLAQYLTNADEFDLVFPNGQNSLFTAIGQGRFVWLNTVGQQLTEIRRQLGVNTYLTFNLDLADKWLFRKNLFEPLDKPLTGRIMSPITELKFPGANKGLLTSVETLLPEFSAMMDDATRQSSLVTKNYYNGLKEAMNGLGKNDRQTVFDALLAGDKSGLTFEPIQLQDLMGERWSPDIQDAYYAYRKIVDDFAVQEDQLAVKTFNMNGYKYHTEGDIQQIVLPIRKVDDIMTEVAYREPTGNPVNPYKTKTVKVETSKLSTIDTVLNPREGYVPIKYKYQTNLVSFDPVTKQTKLISKYRTPADANKAAEYLKTHENPLIAKESQNSIEFIVQPEDISLSPDSKNKLVNISDDDIAKVSEELQKLGYPITNKDNLKVFMEATTARPIKYFQGRTSERVPTTSLEDGKVKVSETPRASVLDSLAEYGDFIANGRKRVYNLYAIQSFENKYASVLKGKNWDEPIKASDFIGDEKLRTLATEASDNQRMMKLVFNNGRTEGDKILKARFDGQMKKWQFDDSSGSKASIKYFLQNQEPGSFTPNPGKFGKKISNLTNKTLVGAFNPAQLVVQTSQVLLSLSRRGFRPDLLSKAAVDSANLIQAVGRYSLGDRRSLEQNTLFNEIYRSQYLSRNDIDILYNVYDKSLGHRVLDASTVLYDAAVATDKTVAYMIERNYLIDQIKRGKVRSLDDSRFLTQKDIGSSEFISRVAQSANKTAINQSPSNLTTATTGDILPQEWYAKIPLLAAGPLKIIERNLTQFWGTMFKIGQNTYNMSAKEKALVVPTIMAAYGFKNLPFMGDLLNGLDSLARGVDTNSTQAGTGRIINTPTPANDFIDGIFQHIAENGSDIVGDWTGATPEEKKEMERFSLAVTKNRGLLAEYENIDLVNRMSVGVFFSQYSQVSTPLDLIAAKSVLEKTAKTGYNIYSFFNEMYKQDAASQELFLKNKWYLLGKDFPLPAVAGAVNYLKNKNYNSYDQESVQQVDVNGNPINVERTSTGYATPIKFDDKTLSNLVLGAKKYTTEQISERFSSTNRLNEFLDDRKSYYSKKLRSAPDFDREDIYKEMGRESVELLQWSTKHNLDRYNIQKVKDTFSQVLLNYRDSINKPAEVKSISAEKLLSKEEKTQNKFNNKTIKSGDGRTHTVKSIQ